MIGHKPIEELPDTSKETRTSAIKELVDEFLASDDQIWEITTNHHGEEIRRSSDRSSFQAGIRYTCKKHSIEGIRATYRKGRLFIVKEG